MTRKQSTSFSPSLFKERIRKIDEAIETENWFSGFTNAVTYFEHYGYWAIRFYCHREKITLTNKAQTSIKRLGASELALILRILELTDNRTYSNMKKIIEERNKVVHPGRRGIRYADKKKKDEATLLLEQAKECLQIIQSTVKGRKE